MDKSEYKIFFEKYMSATSYIQNLRISKGYDEVYAEQYMRYTFGLTDKPVNNRKFSKKQIFYSRLSEHLNEIFYSFEYLKDCEIYISSFPKHKKASKVRYLIYTFENYLNEIYILKCRYKNYLNKLIKWYKNDSRSKEIRVIVYPLFKKMNEMFDFLETIRGSHVHKFRYKPAKFEELESLELLSKAGDKVITNLAESKYVEMRIELKNNITQLNKYIEICLGELLLPTTSIIFGKKSLKYPLKFEPE